MKFLKDENSEVQNLGAWKLYIMQQHCGRRFNWQVLQSILLPCLQNVKEDNWRARQLYYAREQGQLDNLDLGSVQSDLSIVKYTISQQLLMIWSSVLTTCTVEKFSLKILGFLLLQQVAVALCLFAVKYYKNLDLIV